MAKTDMTKAIEKSLLSYSPKIMGGKAINYIRGASTAFEVVVECGTTSSGIVDCIEVNEYFDKEPHPGCYYGAHFAQYSTEIKQRMADRVMLANACDRGHRLAQEFPTYCDCTSCHLNRTAYTYFPHIMIACLEIKISVADFKSKNGHNFFGNCNFYVVPSDIYNAVKGIVPDDIGIIVYTKTERSEGLRMKKDCAFKEITPELLSWTLLNVLKKTRRDNWKRG
jgi:hypothetical protein